MRWAWAVVLCGCAVSWLASGCTVLLDTPSLTGSGEGGSTGVTSGGSASGGAAAGTNAGAGSGGCVPATDPTEYCDGIDNDCDSTTPDVCPSHCKGTVEGGVSYMTCGDVHSWDDAEARCVLQNMHLVKIENATQNAFVLSLAAPLGEWIWIGASDEASNGTFAWTDGAPIIRNGTASAGSYQNFYVGQPTTRATSSCLQITGGPEEPAGDWSSTGCHDTDPYVCSRH
jgi:hypothetical protein